MKVLLDTHCWLWAVSEPDRLSSRARDLLEEARHPLFLSAASSWEIVLKVQAGKLRLPETPLRYVTSRMADQGITALAIQHVHVLRVAELPQHHADPFDRLLVAQAQLEHMTLLTADPEIARYEVEILWGGREEPPRRKTRSRSLRKG